MSWTPTFKLYASDGTTPVYTFPNVQETNLPKDGKHITVVEGVRGIGCVPIIGGLKSFDIIIRGIFQEDNYTDLMTAVYGLQTAIVIGTKYYLKMDKSNSTTDSYKVMRIQEVEYSSDDLRTDVVSYEIILRAYAWA